MKIILLIIAVIGSLGLAACADSSSTSRTTTERAEPRLGSHVPQSRNAAGSEDPANPAIAGERAFAPASVGAPNGGGTR